MRWIFKICLGLASLMATDLAYGENPITPVPPLVFEGQIYETILLDPADGVLVVQERGTERIVVIKIGPQKMSAGPLDTLPQPNANPAATRTNI